MKSSLKEDGSRCKVLVLHVKYARNSPYLNSMVLGLDPERFDVNVCYLKGAPDGKNALDKAGKSIYLEREKSLGGSRIKTIWALVKMLRQERPRILHCHRHKSTVLGTIAAVIAGVPFVISHVHGLGRTRNFSRRFFNFFIFKRISAIIVIAEKVMKDVLDTNWALPSSKVRVVWNGVDTETLGLDGGSDCDRVRKTLDVKEGAVVFGSVGRLALTKGHIYMFEAFSEILKVLPDAVLVIAGKGPLKEELESNAKALGISSSLRFLGYRDDIPIVLKAFDVFVFSSLAEGLPLSILEAMASELPIVSSAVGGIVDIFGEKGDGSKYGFGRLVKAKDSLGLGEAMLEVGSLSSAERKAMGKRARERVLAEFTAKDMRKGIASVYKEVMGL